MRGAHPFRIAVAVGLLVLRAPVARAQAVNPETARVIATADSLLAALSRDDKPALARLVIDSSVVGASALRDGVERLGVRSWNAYLARPSSTRITERGFGATAQVQDRVAQVWMPYDLYLDGRWSHCGVDAFTLVKLKGEWKVAALLYTVEQPPACSRHPAGPPSP